VVVSLACLAAGGTANAGSELKVVSTHNVRDVVITLLTPSGELMTGANAIVVEFDSAPMKRGIDVSGPTLTATLPGSGTSIERSRVRLARGNAVGRYVGKLTLPRAGQWQLEVLWASDGSESAASFPVIVR
jgi:hypothetical protein